MIACRLHAPYQFFGGLDNLFSTPVLTESSLAPFITLNKVVERPARSPIVGLKRTSPCCEVTENEKEFHLSIDLPGVKASDINVEVQEGGRVLTLSGVRHIRQSLPDGTIKSFQSKFEKRLTLDRSIDTDKLSANLSDGVLVITAPKDPHYNDVMKIRVIDGPRLVATGREGMDAVPPEVKESPVDMSTNVGTEPTH